MAGFEGSINHITTGYMIGPSCRFRIHLTPANLFGNVASSFTLATPGLQLATS